MSTLEDNIQSLNDYLAQENSITKDNISLKRNINNMEGELQRSQLNFDRLSSIVFALSLIVVLLFIYNTGVNVMYPFELLVSYLGTNKYGPLILVIVLCLIVFSFLYFSKVFYSKIVTSLVVTGFIYYLLKLLGLDIMGLGLLLTFLFIYFLFDF